MARLLFIYPIAKRIDAYLRKREARSDEPRGH